MTMPDFPPIATFRLRLACLTLAEAPELRDLTDDPAIVAAIHFLAAPVTLAFTESLLRGEQAGIDWIFGIRRREDRRLVGIVGAGLVGAGRLEIGYWLGSTWHGRGYATEAVGALLETLQCEFPERSIFAECRCANLASWRVLEKLDFQPTGRAGERPERELLLWNGTSARD
jgi:RimJ/RimL family protein N-acetyltransferase